MMDWLTSSIFFELSIIEILFRQKTIYKRKKSRIKYPPSLTICAQKKNIFASKNLNNKPKIPVYYNLYNRSCLLTFLIGK